MFADFVKKMVEAFSWLLNLGIKHWKWVWLLASLAILPFVNSVWLPLLSAFCALLVLTNNVGTFTVFAGVQAKKVLGALVEGMCGGKDRQLSVALFVTGAVLFVLGFLIQNQEIAMVGGSSMVFGIVAFIAKTSKK